MQHFQIPCKRKLASVLKVTNEEGKVFSKRKLNNHLVLFPNPKITFYLHNNQQATASSGKNRIAFSGNNSVINSTTTMQQRNQKPKDESDYEYDPTYPTTPVFRMNCFKGVYPSKCSPPPKKRVRFSESSNSVIIIPGRSQTTTEVVKGALRRTSSFVGEYPQMATQSKLTEEHLN